MFGIQHFDDVRSLNRFSLHLAGNCGFAGPGRAIDLMAESSAEIDAKYGTDILSKVYNNLRKERLNEF